MVSVVVSPEQIFLPVVATTGFAGVELIVIAVAFAVACHCQCCHGCQLCRGCHFAIAAMFAVA